MRRLLLGRVLPVFSVLCGLLSPLSAEAKVFDPEVFTLKNGMTVVVVENHRAPIVKHMVWYKVGAADEPAGKSGLAHLLEHMMFKGTNDIPEGAFSKIIAEHGGQDNAMTSRDFTAYFQSIAVKHLPMVMKMEADRMTNLQFTQDQFESERQVVREERLQRVENQPGAMLAERLSMGIWMNHPYAHPIGGFDSEILGLTKDDALKFYKTWYAPNSAILLVAGDVTPKQVKSLAETYYGAIPRAETPPRHRPEPEAPPADIQVTFSAPTVQQPAWYRTNIVPSCATTEQRITASYDVLAEILGSGTTSRLYKKLVLTDKTVLGVSASYNGLRAGPGEFTIFTSPKPDTDVATLADTIAAEIKSIADNGISQDDLNRVTSRMLAAQVFARDDVFGAPQILPQALSVGCSVAQIESFADDVAALTSADIQTAAQSLLTPHAVGHLISEPTEASQ